MTNRIKELRKAAGYRQEDLARALGVTRQTIIAIENDKYDPSLVLAMKLARFLQTTVEELFALKRMARSISSGLRGRRSFQNGLIAVPPKVKSILHP